AEGTIELINFLKNRGCYVIGGVPTNWRTESRDSKPNFLEAYKTYDMVSPWSAGRYRSVAAVDNHTEDYWVPDNNFCKANNMDYMPCVFPGFAWSTWKGGKPNSIPRENGEFLWRQAYKIKEAGMDQVYFGMFDEYDEGTNIMNGATDWTQIPTDQYFLTQSADGMWLSSDFYLRLSGEATEMLKSSGAPYETFKIDYSEGPVYYRNSFEKRLTTFDSDNDGTFESTGEYNIDPCFHNPDFISNSNVSSAKFEIEKMESNAKSGLYYAKATGTPTSSISASSYFKMADVKIPVEENMQIAYWKNTVNTLGRYVNIDLIFESGKKLSQLPNYINNKGKSMAASKGIGTTGAGWEYIICKLGEGELLGDTITGIVIAYDKPYPSDEFKAYFDDIIISTDLEAYNPDTSIKNYKTFSKIIVKGSRLDFSQFPLDSKINIYNLTGCSVSNFQLKNPIVNTNLPHGVYIVSILNYNGNYSQKIIL
ncbi:T9SS type A sorting domain-containing protein, partial [Marinilabilia sp.]